jgi:AraC-like DNA-binding protein
VVIEENVIGLFQRGLERAFDRPAPRRAATDADHRRVVDAVRGFLTEHLTDSLDLDRLARATGVSPYHLCRVFKRQTGYSIGTYLHRLRLGAAVDAMTDPSRSLSGIALDHGFYSHSHFTSVFNRHYGRSPSRLRAELCGRRRAGGAK